MILKFHHLLLTAVLPAAAFGQGSLIPPGAPGPTMKTLDQVEARTPVAGGTTAVTISQSGSYYLTGNLTVASGDAINVTAQNVTLNLNGFTVATTATTPSGTGVLVSNVRITVCNGSIYGVGYGGGGSYSGGGFINGVATAIPTAEGVVVRDLSISGCAGYGIKLFGNGYAGSRAERCFVDNTGSNGLAASIVVGCASYNCAGTAISAMEVSDSSGYGSLDGIDATNAKNCEGRGGTYGIQCGTANNCTGTSTGTGSSGVGLTATTAVSCTGTQQNGGTGLNAQNATSCQGSSTSGVGLFALTATTCAGTSSSGIGLQVNTGSQCSGTTTSGTYGAYGNTLNNCQGITNGSGTGLQGYYTATNCLGISQGGVGLRSTMAMNCFGQTSVQSAVALVCSGTATSCYGVNPVGNGAYGIDTIIAIGCRVGAGNLISASNRYNEPN